MKIKIDQDGLLKLHRMGQVKDQACPFASSFNHDVFCGDWCPLFREPIDGYCDLGQIKVLEICQGRKLRALACDFIDERKDDESWQESTR